MRLSSSIVTPPGVQNLWTEGSRDLKEVVKKLPKTALLTYMFETLFLSPARVNSATFALPNVLECNEPWLMGDPSACHLAMLITKGGCNRISPPDRFRAPVM